MKIRTWFLLGSIAVIAYAVEVQTNFDVDSEIDSFGKVFRFTVNTTELESKCVESSEVVLSRVSWSVKVCKTDIGIHSGKSVLSVFLISDFDDDTTLWSCEASAKFKLLQNDCPKSQNIVKSLQKQKFSEANSTFGIDAFVDWDDFLNQNAYKNKAVFEVDISTNPFNPLPISNIEQMTERFHFKLRNVTELTQVYSPELVLQGVRWRVKTEKTTPDYYSSYNREAYLSVSLIANEQDLYENWSWNTTFALKVLSFKENINTKWNNFTQNFHWARLNWSISHVMTWSHFMDPSYNYVGNNSTVFLIELTVDTPKPMWRIDQNVTEY